MLLDPHGEVLLALGEVHTPIYPRSSNKPMQAVGLLRSGFVPVDSRELAIATASHYGEPEHVAVVHRLLQRTGLDENRPAVPAGPAVRRAGPGRGAGLRRSGVARISHELLRQARGDARDLRGQRLARSTATSSPAHPLQQAVLGHRSPT